MTRDDLKIKYGKEIEQDLNAYLDEISADINNKLTPVKNLVALLSFNTTENKTERVKNLISQNIEDVRTVLDYLTNYSENTEL